MIELTLPELISYLSPLLKVKGLIEKILPKENKVQTSFRYAIRDTARRLQEKYNDALGGSAESILLGEIEPIFKAFETYGHLSDLKDDIKEVHFENLPDGFYNDFKSFLIEELIKFTETEAVLHEYFKTLQLDEIHESSMLLPKMDQKLDSVVSKVDQLLNNTGHSKQTFQSIKHRYQTDVANFIERALKPSSDSLAEKYLNKTLLDLIETNTSKRIVLLNYAGNGKSEELNHLAYKLSDSESIFEPILLNLGTIQGQSLMDILNDGYPGWRYLKANLVLILDALDEVKIDLMDDVKGQILNISSLLDQSTIVVACRTNVYNLNRMDDSGYLTGFTHFELPPFSDQNVWHYLINRFNTNEAQEVLAQAKRLGLSQDLTTPFYLVRLSDYYSQRTSLPNSKKELFEWLIYQLKEKEKIKSVALGDKIEENEEELDIAISKVACLLQITDKNYLNPSELRKTVNNKELVELLKSCYLLDRGTENKWRFEHNNFKEYLAAKFMAQKGFEFIRSIIFIPTINKIKPSWLNTLGFLISYLDEKSNVLNTLIKFIEEHDPQTLVRVEKDKIDKKIREKLFLSLLNDAKSKGIYPHSNKFSLEDLREFVSDSKGSCDYLVNRIDLKNDISQVDLCCYLLQKNDFWSTRKKDIESRLSIIIQSDTTDFTKKKNAIEALGWFEIYLQSLTEFMLSNLASKDKELKDAIYYYLVETEHVESHIEFLVDVFLEEHYSKDFKYEVIPKMSSEDSFLRCINQIALSRRFIDGGDYLLTQIIDELIDKRVFTEDLSESIYRTFQTQHLSYNGENLRQAFSKYMDATKMKDKFFHRSFEEYAESEDKHSMDIVPICFLEEHVSYVLQYIEERNWSDQQIRKLRNLLNWTSNRDAFDNFYQELNRKYFDKFLWEEFQDPYVRQLRFQVKLLSDQESFFQLLKKLFADVRKTRKELYKSEYLDPEPIACLKILGKIMGERPWSCEELMDYLIINKNWQILRILCYLDLIRSQQNVLTEVEIQFLRSWTRKELKRKRFADNIKLLHRSRYAAGLCQYFDLELTKEAYRKLLKVDSHHILYLIKEDASRIYNPSDLMDSKLLQYLISKMGEEEIQRQIVNNLGGKLFNDVRFNHLKFLRKRKADDCKQLFINGASNLDYRLLVWYIELGGYVQYAVDRLESYEDYEKGRIMDAIVERDKVVLREYLFNKINDLNNEDQKASLINKLLYCNDSRALGLMRDWIFRNKRLFGDSELILNANIDNRLKLATAKEVYSHSLRFSYGNDVAFGRRSFLDIIVRLGLESYDAYNDSQAFLKKMVKDYPEAKILYGTIENMEFQFYENQKHLMGLEEAIELVNHEVEIDLEKTPLTNSPLKPINLAKHKFEVALSFPGEVREYVDEIASSLASKYGKGFCFYDNNFKSQLAQPNIDLKLQKVYRESKIIVVFLCEKYQEKEWCGIEFRVVRDLIKQRNDEQIMFVKMDDGMVEGTFSIDGYIDALKYSPEEIVKFVLERLSLID